MTQQTAFEILDNAVDPIFQELNKMRQVWDSIDPRFQTFVPRELQAPMLLVFGMVETADRAIGIAREKGLLPPRVQE